MNVSALKLEKSIANGFAAQSRGSEPRSIVRSPSLAPLSLGSSRGFQARRGSPQPSLNRQIHDFDWQRAAKVAESWDHRESMCSLLIAGGENNTGAPY